MFQNNEGRKQKMQLRQSVGCVLLIMMCFALETVCAQPTNFSKPVRLIVGFPPGGASDIVARVIAQALTPALGQQVIVDNRAGAGGALALQLLKQTSPDGYSLLLASDSQLAVALLDSKLGVNVQRDFEPVAFVGAANFTLSVPSSLPAKNLKEFIALARTKNLNTGSGGDVLSLSLITQMRSVTKAQLTHVPFKGTGPAVVELASGGIESAVLPVGQVVPHARAGRIRVITTFASQRVRDLPDVPTALEQGVPLLMFNGYGLLAPAGLPKTITATLEKAVASVVGRSEVQEMLRKQFIEPNFFGREPYRLYVQSFRARQGLGGAEPALDSCSKCTSDVCQKPGEDCKVCCQRG
jgi:tripartite-type tricarboxylate transporter receptor subunit TctC